MESMEIKYSFRELKAYLPVVMKAGCTPAIWGPPGVGKSTLGREVAKALNADLYILDAPLLQPIDYAVAVPDRDSKKVVLYTTGFIPEKGPAVILIEDLPHAKPYQMVPIMQMVLDRRIGTLKFSDNVYFVITGNRDEDLAGTNPIPSPLNNRLIHFTMDADPEEWTKWAEREGLHRYVVGFVKAYPGMLVKPPEDGVKAWPTPRSYHMLARLLAEAEKEDRLTEESLRALASASIGSSAAHMFVAWVKYYSSINPQKVLAGEIPNTQDRTQMFAVALSVAGYLKKAKTMPPAESLRRFFSRLPGEMKVMFLKELVDCRHDRIDTELLRSVVSRIPEASSYVIEILSYQENRNE